MVIAGRRPSVVTRSQNSLGRSTLSNWPSAARPSTEGTPGALNKHGLSAEGDGPPGAVRFDRHAAPSPASWWPTVDRPRRGRIRSWDGYSTPVLRLDPHSVTDRVTLDGRRDAANGQNLPARVHLDHRWQLLVGSSGVPGVTPGSRRCYRLAYSDTAATAFGATCSARPSSPTPLTSRWLAGVVAGTRKAARPPSP